MDKATRNAIENDPYPIQVTKPLGMSDLKKWIRHFEDQGIKTNLQVKRMGLYVLLRKLTPEEIEECEDGKWAISGKSFRNPESERTRPYEKR